MKKSDINKIIQKNLDSWEELSKSSTDSREALHAELMACFSRHAIRKESIIECNAEIQSVIMVLLAQINAGV